MGEFDADKLGERLEQLNREQLAALETLSEKLLREMQAYKPVPKRADEAPLSSAGSSVDAPEKPRGKFGGAG